MNIQIVYNYSPKLVQPNVIKGVIIESSQKSDIIINTSNKFILEDTILDSLATDWLSFAIKELMSKEINSDKRLKKDFDLFKAGKINILEINDYLKELIMLSGNYRIMDFCENNKIKMRLNYLDLINILTSKEKIKTRTTYSLKHLIDRFFIEQWAKGKLLYPLVLDERKKFHRKFDFEIFLKECNIPVLSALYNYAKLYNKVSLLKNTFYVLLSTNWRYLSDVKNEDILKIKEIVETKDINPAQKRYYKKNLNFIVYALIDAGRTDLKTPYEFTSSLFPKEFLFYKKVDELAEKCPNFYPLKKDFIEYITYLDIKEQLAKSTIAIKRSHLMIFIDYLIEKKCNCSLLQQVFDDMFNFMKNDNIINYITQLKGKRSNSIIKDIAIFLGYIGYLSPYIKKMIPKERKRIKETPRIPFSADMMKDLVDILINRPTFEPTKWSKEKADINWWKHDVYPVLPMMILLHLYLPLRGSQIRNLCRKNSFLLNNEGKIERIIVNTDKNRHRDYLQEIPFVFEGLEILNDFLKWHKEYYPHLPLYEYDKNSPFKKIEPIFIQPLSLKPVDKKTHFLYLKRVLAQYRIELNNKGNKSIHFIYLTEEGKEKLNKDFFETIEELNNATNEFMDNYVKTIYDIHTFRVTGVTRYLEAGLPINVVMMLTGHTNPNIMLNVYNKLTNENKKQLLKSAELKIMFDNPSKLKENTEELIKKEILPHYDEKNPDKLKNILTKNNLFTQEVKKNSNSSVKINSIEEISKISPFNWIPVAGGICPNIVCPDGREKKCSLCPYFITGIYFIDGIIFRANNAVLNFYQKVEEYNLSKDKSKVDDLELLMEEIYGWYEILHKIQNENISNEGNMPVKKKEIAGIGNIPNVLAYLENCYNAKLLQTAPNIYGIKVLTIKAIKLALKSKDADLPKMINDEKKAVDYIMNYYQNIKQSPDLLTDFLRNIGEDIKRINKSNNIGYNYG